MSSEQYWGGESDPAAVETATVASCGAGFDGAAAPRAPVFLPSEVLADRFRVVRLLGRGGMGEIYEVEDFELGERVAIKTLRSRLSGSDGALALFRNEIQLARRITHPNVCRTFDVFRHRRDTEAGRQSVAFVTMELLPGESLAARLRRDGPMTLAAALPLLRQIAAALDAAHDAGVVHRDLKSGNVVLVDDTGGPRAVVADFGLASAVEEASGGNGTPYGTRPYRAPEQEAGESVGASADVYAFGVVVAEVLTGRAEWSAAEPRLSPPVAELLRRCLAPRPEDRPQRACEVIRRLERLAHPGGSRRRRLAVAAVAALVSLLPVAVLATWPLHGGPGPRTPAAPLHPQIAVLVTAPDGDVECPDCVAIEISELLDSELQGSGLEVMDPAVLYGYWGLAPALRGDQQQRRAGLDVLAADLLAEVRVSAETADRWRYAVAVLGDGESVAARAGAGDGHSGGAGPRESWPRRWTLTAAPGDLSVVATALAARLREALGITVPPPSAAQRRMLVGSDPEARRLYARGCDNLRLQVTDAVSLFRQAAAREPDVFRYQRALGAALAQTNVTSAEAAEPAARARRLAVRIGGAAGRDARLRAELLVAEAARDWTGALDASRALARLHPERIEPWAVAIGMALTAGRADEAENIFDELRETAPAVARNPWILEKKTELAYAAGDPAAALASARASVRRSAELGLENPLFEARWQEFRALRDLGRSREAGPLVEETVALAESTGRRRWLGNALRWRGILDIDAGDEAAGEETIRRALDLARESHDENNTVWCLNALALLAARHGDLEQAATMWEQALVPLRKFYNQHQLLFMRSNLTEIWFLMGRLDDAEQACREIHSGAQVGGDAVVEALVLARLAQIALARGELPAAERHLEQAESWARRSAIFLLPEILATRARLDLLRGDPAAARRAAESAMAQAQAFDSAESKAEAVSALAAVELAEGRAERSLDDYRRALDFAHDIPAVVLAASVEREMGSVERQLGDKASARRRLTAALGAHRRSGCRLEVAHDQRALAELYRDTGETAAAAEAARDALETYRRLGAALDATAVEALLRDGEKAAPGAPLGARKGIPAS